MWKMLSVTLASLALFVCVQGINRGMSGTVWPTETEQPSSEVETGGYLNSWAVKITGGTKAADKVARRYGFDNLGLVGLLYIVTLVR